MRSDAFILLHILNSSSAFGYSWGPCAWVGEYSFNFGQVLLANVVPSDRRDLAIEHSWQGHVHRRVIQLGMRDRADVFMTRLIRTQMNNFIVGQVTPTMLQHLGFGTFVFFGVSCLVMLVCTLTDD